MNSNWFRHPGWLNSNLVGFLAFQHDCQTRVGRTQFLWYVSTFISWVANAGTMMGIFPGVNTEYIKQIQIHSAPEERRDGRSGRELATSLISVPLFRVGKFLRENVP